MSTHRVATTEDAAGKAQRCNYSLLRLSSEKAMATHSSTLAWQIPWTEEPGRLQSMGSLRVGHDWTTSLSLFTFMNWRRKWQPTPVFLPGESQGRGPGGLPSLGSHRVGHDWSDLAAAAAGLAYLLKFPYYWYPFGLSIGLFCFKTINVPNGVTEPRFEAS